MSAIASKLMSGAEVQTIHQKETHHQTPSQQTGNGHCFLLQTSKPAGPCAQIFNRIVLSAENAPTTNQNDKKQTTLRLVHSGDQHTVNNSLPRRDFARFV